MGVLALKIHAGRLLMLWENASPEIRCFATKKISISVVLYPL